jgi:hypothetical protein
LPVFFFLDTVLWFYLRLASVGDPPTYASYMAGITGMNHIPGPQIFC